MPAGAPSTTKPTDLIARRAIVRIIKPVQSVLEIFTIDRSESISTNILIGAPRTKPRKKRLEQLSQLLGDIEAVREAHFPQVIEFGSDDPPRHILFIVVQPATSTTEVIDKIRSRIDSLPDRDKVEVRAIDAQHDLLTAIRGANCVVGWRD